MRVPSRVRGTSHHTFHWAPYQVTPTTMSTYAENLISMGHPQVKAFHHTQKMRCIKVRARLRIHWLLNLKQLDCGALGLMQGTRADCAVGDGDEAARRIKAAWGL